MPQPSLSDEEALKAVEAYNLHGNNQCAAADALNLSRGAFQNRLRIAARRGLMGTSPVLPGYYISQTTQTPNGGQFIQQKPERGDQFEVPPGHAIKGVSALVDANGQIIQQWFKTSETEAQRDAAMQAALDGFKDKLPSADIILPPTGWNADLLSQYTITDAHLGALAWNEETGGGDYDLSIGEKLVTNWFASAVASAPPSKRAVLAQLGDFLHYDSFKSITPEHGNLLDGDSRYPKMVRTAIRVLRSGIAQLLTKHEQVDVIMCDANHDPAGGVWLREFFSVHYEHEPRVRVDTNPGTYSYVEHGDVSLFYHHGHRRKTDSVDSMLVGKFRQLYGRTRFSYAHTGHKHQDELKTTDLMKVEQHETLAAPDAYGSNWLSGRSAKVITYHARHGEVGRITLTPEMVTP
jgi:hypothetical protein